MPAPATRNILPELPSGEQFNVAFVSFSYPIYSVFGPGVIRFLPDRMGRQNLSFTGSTVAVTKRTKTLIGVGL